MSSSYHSLGGGAVDAVEVKGHVFFQTINWTDLYDRKVRQSS